MLALELFEQTASRPILEELDLRLAVAQHLSHNTCQTKALGPTPPVLADLLSAQTARGRAFRENIRRYNVSLAMASSGGNCACKGSFATVQYNVACEVAFVFVIS